MVIYSVIHKRVFTPPRDLTTRIIEAIDHSSKSTMAFTKKFTSEIFCKCKCHYWVWRMIDSLYYSSRKIPERWENSFVNYRINNQKLCYSLRRIWTQPMYLQWVEQAPGHFFTRTLQYMTPVKHFCAYGPSTSKSET